MTPFELDYRRLERQPQLQQLFITVTPAIEEIFEILETSDIDKTLPHSMIEPILNRNFGNTFQHQNGPNQHQHTHKNTGQNHQHRNTSQQYQHISFQIPSTSSIPYKKENCIGCVNNNKVVR